MKYVYLIHTPYHLMLSVLLSPSQRSARLVLITDNSTNWTRYLPFLYEWYGADLVSVVPTWKSSIWGQFVFRPPQMAKIFYGELVSVIRNDRRIIRLFNDSDLNVQYLLDACDVEIEYVEDGSAAYHRGSLVRNRFADILRCLSSNCRYEAISVLGKSHWIRRRWAIYPFLTRPELHPCGEINTSALALEALTELGRQLGVTDRNSGPYAIVLTPADDSNDKILSWFSARIDDARIRGLRIVVKDHPRRIGPSHFDKPGDFVANSFVPVELMALCDSELVEVITLANTSCVAIRKFAPTVSVHALFTAEFTNDSDFKKVVRTLGGVLYEL